MGELLPKFIGEPIEVELGGPPDGVLAPVRFTWRGRIFQVVAIHRVFAEAGWPRTARSRAWWLKRHRNHFIVRADDGHVYQLTLDRSGRKRQWLLLKQLE